MCGIVACVGVPSCTDFVLRGLSALEYRGYDSAGLAFVRPNSRLITTIKSTGFVDQLRVAVEQDQVVVRDDACIGHTRWATHGKATTENAHPQSNCDTTVAVVHNGIIDHFDQLKKLLIEQGHHFVSQTDTEVLAHLFSDLYQKNNKDGQAALAQLVTMIDGAYALVFMHIDSPGALFIARKRSPLVIGVSEHGHYVASDHLAFGQEAERVVYVPDDVYGVVTKDAYQLFSAGHHRVTVQSEPFVAGNVSLEKSGFDHYMLKEMYEQQHVITRTINFYAEMMATTALWQQLAITLEQVRDLEHIVIIGAGSSWHAGRIAQFFFEQVPQIKTEVYLASEFTHMPFFSRKKTAYIFVSQSGETADTLQALRFVTSLEPDAITIALTNVAASSLVRECNGFLLMHAGTEISVASTKAFSCQIASLYWLSNEMAYVRGRIDDEYREGAYSDLIQAAQQLEYKIDQYASYITENKAAYYAQFDRYIFLGRHIAYPFALEAALKLKEISYIFAQCYPAGELKHGPIALVDAKTPIVLFSSGDEKVYRKLLANAQEVKARDGHLIVFALADQHELCALADTVFIFEETHPLLLPLVMTGVMQLFAYAVTCQLGRPIDKPRNLAKSVTVE